MRLPRRAAPRSALPSALSAASSFIERFVAYAASAERSLLRRYAVMLPMRRCRGAMPRCCAAASHVTPPLLRLFDVYGAMLPRAMMPRAILPRAMRRRRRCRRIRVLPLPPRAKSR